MASKRRRTRKRPRQIERKDRLIQTRVDEDLEQTLKREAARQRLTVSHLIRNTLEDAFNLVHHVTSDVGQLVTGSVELAAAVGRESKRLAAIVRGRGEPGAASGSEASEPATRGASGIDTAESRPSPARSAQATTASPATSDANASAPATPSEDDLGHVYGWNRVIAHRSAECARCRASIAQSDEALVGLSDDPTKPRAWLCQSCAARL